MKGFFATLLVVCGVLAAAWFTWDPYVKPLLDRIGGGTSLSDNDRLITEGPDAGASPAASVAANPAPATAASSAPATKSAPSAATTPAPSAPKSEIERFIEARYPMPEILPLLTIVDEWRNVPPNAFPAEVVSSEAVPFQLVIDGQAVGSSSVAPGTPLKPVRLDGTQLHVASLADPGKTTPIDLAKTDFKQRIEGRYQQFVEMKQQEVATKRAKAKQILEADPSRLAALTGKPSAAGSSDASGDPRIAPVKESLRKGEAPSVTLEEAKSFHWNGSETVRGPFPGTYDTVTVNFEVATIFGRFPIEYKCLLRGSSVVGWIDPVTEERVSQ